MDGSAASNNKPRSIESRYRKKQRLQGVLSEKVTTRKVKLPTSTHTGKLKQNNGLVWYLVYNITTMWNATENHINNLQDSVIKTNDDVLDDERLQR